MKLTTEMIEKILNDAPEGAEIVVVGRYIEYYNNADDFEKLDCLPVESTANQGFLRDTVHSIEDLREIISIRKRTSIENIRHLGNGDVITVNGERYRLLSSIGETGYYPVIDKYGEFLTLKIEVK